MNGNLREVNIGALALKGLFGAPEAAKALIIFAHGSGSGRLSPRNNYVAEALRESGLATLLLDLLTPEEELRRSNVFDIPLLAKRLLMATAWAKGQTASTRLPIGYFGRAQERARRSLLQRTMTASSRSSRAADALIWRVTRSSGCARPHFSSSGAKITRSLRLTAKRSKD
jgi:putative phosphoribosyl transferase